MREWWQAGDEELLLAVGAAQHAMNEVFAAMLPVVAEISARGVAGDRGFRDAADLLRTVQNVSRSTANARSNAAAALVPGPAISGEPQDAELPELAAAVAEAAVSSEHVRVVQAALAAVPPHLSEHRPVLEADLTLYSRTLDPDAVAKLGKKAIAMLDPDGPRPRDPHPTRTRLTLRPLGDGVEARGWFDQESAAILRTALSPLSAPMSAVCAEGCAPAARPDGHAATDGGHERADGAPPCGHAAVERDPRSVAERQGDGLVELARRMLAVGELGDEGGQRPQVTVTVPLQVLESRCGAGLLGFGDGTLAGVITAETARRYACDARVVPIVLGGSGEPLNVGRGQRVANRAMRRALAQRDGGCAFPGCDAPPQWTEAHHIVHWADRGITALSNLVLLCSRHHTVIHTQEWEISMDGGFPLFHPPPWIPGGPRRNPVHRPDLVARATGPAPRRPVQIANLDALAPSG